ncbi:MAG TPA: hypothetical protein VNJ08_14975 [Bacteriovoracaceae bacterium]|nr:hypothetical protein [Bacteriovoracaceae bacterium]
MKIFTLSLLTLMVASPLSMAEGQKNEKEVDAINTELRSEKETRIEDNKVDDERQEEQAMKDDPFIDNNGNGSTTNPKVEQ